MNDAGQQPNPSADGNGNQGNTPKPPANTAVLPAGLIADDETVLWLARPSAWFLLLPALRAYLVPTMAGVIALAIGGTNENTPLLVGGLAGVVFLRFVWQWLNWVNRVYAITDRQLIMVHGVFTTQTLRVPRENVQHSSVVRSFLEQLTGIGSLLAATAGTGYSEVVFQMINHPYDTQNLLTPGSPAPGAPESGATAKPGAAEETFNVEG